MAISYNVPITFGKYGTARALNCSGIDFSEEGTQSWTSAPSVELDIQLPPARQDVIVQLEASPYVIPDVVSAQQVFIYLGGMFVGFYRFTNFDIRSFPVNRNIIAGRPNRLSLVLPNATSPKAMQLSEDRRELGIYLSTIVFKTIS